MRCAQKVSDCVVHVALVALLCLGETSKVSASEIVAQRRLAGKSPPISSPNPKKLTRAGKRL
jgi:hypothetical protein